MKGVSFIIPVYNTGIYLEDCLSSIFQYKFKFPIEVILINDGSTDPLTLEILKDKENIPNVFVHSIKNVGASQARNIGFKKTKYPYIFNLDSDDELIAHEFDKAFHFYLQHPKHDILYSSYEVIGDKQYTVESENFEPLKLYFSGNYISNNSLYKREVFETIEGYDSNLIVCEDYDFWVRASCAGFNFIYYDKPIFRYRIIRNSNSLSHSNQALYPESKAMLRERIPVSEVNLERLNSYFLHSTKRNQKMAVKILIYTFFPKVYSFLRKKRYFQK